jgi:hypothetical protein
LNIAAVNPESKTPTIALHWVANFQSADDSNDDDDDDNDDEYDNDDDDDDDDNK